MKRTTGITRATGDVVIINRIIRLNDKKGEKNGSGRKKKEKWGKKKL